MSFWKHMLVSESGSSSKFEKTWWKWSCELNRMFWIKECLDHIVMYIDQGYSITELCTECPDVFWHSYLREGIVKSVMAGLCSVFVGYSAVNSDTYCSGRKTEPSSYVCNDLSSQGHVIFSNKDVQYNQQDMVPTFCSIQYLILYDDY